MTEKEKCDLGLMYNPLEFIGDMFAARDKCTEYSNIPFSEFERRVEFIKNLFDTLLVEITICVLAKSV